MKGFEVCNFQSALTLKELFKVADAFPERRLSFTSEIDGADIVITDVAKDYLTFRRVRRSALKWGKTVGTVILVTDDLHYDCVPQLAMLPPRRAQQADCGNMKQICWAVGKMMRGLETGELAARPDPEQFWQKHPVLDWLMPDE